MPVILASKRGVIKAAIIRGDAPLLLSRSALKALGATLNFEKDCLHVFQQVVPLETNSAGQYMVHLVGQPSDTMCTASFNEVMASVEAPDDEPEINTAPPASADTTPPVSTEAASFELDPAAPSLLTWTQENSDVVSTPWLSRTGLRWNSVVRRKVIDCE